MDPSRSKAAGALFSLRKKSGCWLSVRAGCCKPVPNLRTAFFFPLPQGSVPAAAPLRTGYASSATHKLDQARTALSQREAERAPLLPSSAAAAAGNAMQVSWAKTSVRSPRVLFRFCVSGFPWGGGAGGACLLTHRLSTWLLLVLCWLPT